MTPRTYGRLTFHPARGEKRDRWKVTCEPHVMTRLKRLFSRHTRDGLAVWLSDSRDVSRDLEWFLERYPMVMDDVSAARLSEQADAHRGQQEEILALLGGAVRDGAVRPPAITPRPYQAIAVNVLAATGRLLCTDEVGLGKTIVGALALNLPDALPAVVVCPTHLPGQWEKEINVALPWLRTHVARKGTPYDPTTLRGIDEQPDVLILPYSKLFGWGDYLAASDVRTIVFDEMQELRRRGTGKYDSAKAIAAGAQYRLGLTATPVYNYGGEAYNVVSVLDPDVLGTPEEFSTEWCKVEESTGKSIVKDPPALGAYLRDQGVMLGRTRTEVGRELPQTVVAVQTVSTDTGVIDQAVSDAAELARLILSREGSTIERLHASSQLDLAMRQATGIAKAVHVANVVKLLLESEEKILLCGWHRGVYDLWLNHLREFNPVLYTGSETAAQKVANAERFMNGDSRVLIMSLRSGAGLNGLQNHCRVVVFGELDWSPQVHEQVIGRLRREGQDENESVVAYYLVSEEGSDPAVQGVLQLKRNQAEPMLSKDGKLFDRAEAQFDRVKELARAVLAAAGDPPEPEAAPTDPFNDGLPVLDLATI